MKNCGSCTGFMEVTTTNGKSGFCFKGSKYRYMMLAAGQAPVRFKWSPACSEYRAKGNNDKPKKPRLRKAFRAAAIKVKPLKRPKHR